MNIFFFFENTFQAEKKKKHIALSNSQITLYQTTFLQIQVSISSLSLSLSLSYHLFFFSSHSSPQYDPFASSVSQPSKPQHDPSFHPYPPQSIHSFTSQKKRQDIPSFLTLRFLFFLSLDSFLQSHLIVSDFDTRKTSGGFIPFFFCFDGGAFGRGGGGESC